MSVLVLGAGKMTEAILLGLKSQVDLSQWKIYSPSGVSAERLAKKVGAEVLTDINSMNHPEWVLIGCKPQQLLELKKTIGVNLSQSLFVSMLAAVPEDEQRKILGTQKLIRIMPNLPVELQSGITLISSQSASEKLPEFQKIFSKLGLALTVSEEELEELTLLTGSGPAFFYEFTKHLAQSFTSLSESERENLARFVMLGAAKMATGSSKTLSEMTGSVTSKGGVTIAVLEKWRELDLFSFLKKGVDSGKKRSQEIKDLLRK